MTWLYTTDPVLLASGFCALGALFGLAAFLPWLGARGKARSAGRGEAPALTDLCDDCLSELILAAQDELQRRNGPSPADRFSPDEAGPW